MLRASIGDQEQDRAEHAARDRGDQDADLGLVEIDTAKRQTRDEERHREADPCEQPSAEDVNAVNSFGKPPACLPAQPPARSGASAASPLSHDPTSSCR